MRAIAMWDPAASIVFVQSLLPIAPTQTSATKQVGSNNFVVGGNSSNLLSSMSDCAIAVDVRSQKRPTILYKPGAGYGLPGMHSAMSLSKIYTHVYLEG